MLLSGPVDTVGLFVGPCVDSSSSQICLFRLPDANAKLCVCLFTSVSLLFFFFFPLPPLFFQKACRCLGTLSQEVKTKLGTLADQ